MWKSLSLILLTGIPIFGQNSVTVTASRPTNAQPDLVVFNVDVLTGTNATRDDVLAALEGSVITAANFSGVRTIQQFSAVGVPQQSFQSLDWTFSLTAPLANFKATISQLTALQQIVAQKKNGMSLSFSIAGTQLSPQAQQGLTCSTADLLSDARTQAQKMAVAAGGALGSVLAMSSAAVTQPASGALFSSPVFQPVCSLTVKFALTGF
jgi:hypothetical protein